MSDFNRGSTGAGRRRSLGLMPGESTGEGAPGNVIPRGTTLASIRRGQALLRMLNDRLPDGQEFSRGSTAGSRRRNFSLMAMLEDAAPTSGLQLVTANKLMPISSDYDIEFDSAVYDPEGMWNPPSEVECITAGTYTVEFSLTVVAYGDPISFSMLVNGSPVTTDTFPASSTLCEATHSLSLLVGDIVKLRRNSQSGSGTQELTNGTWTFTRV